MMLQFLKRTVMDIYKKSTKFIQIRYLQYLLILHNPEKAFGISFSLTVNLRQGDLILVWHDFSKSTLGGEGQKRLCPKKHIYGYFRLASLQDIWLIFTRTVTLLEIFRWFTQIVFTLLTSVRPINVGFSNRFFC